MDTRKLDPLDQKFLDAFEQIYKMPTSSAQLLFLSDEVMGAYIDSVPEERKIAISAEWKRRKG